jgi:hypothetical protein
MSAIPVHAPLTTGRIARMMSSEHDPWSRKRVARWLDGLAKVNGAVFVRVNGRRMPTTASIRLVCPEFGKRFATVADVESVREEQEEQAADIRVIADKFREFREKSAQWYEGLSRRVDAVEKTTSGVKMQRPQAATSGRGAQ